jgi:DNA polymerase-3 subunit alpha
MGIQVLPPDINESSYFFTVGSVPAGSNGSGRGNGQQSAGATLQAIRFGLGAVKGVGEGAIESVLTARRRVGRFHSLAHLASEIDLRLANRKVLECLIKAGAFDSLAVERAALLTVLDDVLDYGQRRRREREEGQGTLFGLLGAAGDGAPAHGIGREPAPDAATPPWSERERLRYEKEALGLYLTGNPLSEHQEALSRLTTHSTADLKEGAEGTVTVGGVVSGFNRVKIKSGPNAGRFMGRFVLEDLQGSMAVTLFANQLQQFGHLVADEAVILVKGQVRDRNDRPGDAELTVEEIVPLERLRTRQLAGLDLVVAPDLPTAELLRLRDLLYHHPGTVPVTLHVQLASRTVRIAAQDNCKVEVGPELATAIEAILGPGSVRERPERAA